MTNSLIDGATEIHGNRDCVACEGGGWIISFSQQGKSQPCPSCNPNYERPDNRFYKEKDMAKSKKLEGDEALDLDIYMRDQLLSDKIACEALHLLIGKGYSAAEVRLALEKLSK